MVRGVYVMLIAFESSRSCFVLCFFRMIGFLIQYFVPDLIADTVLLLCLATNIMLLLIL